MTIARAFIIVLFGVGVGWMVSVRHTPTSPTSISLIATPTPVPFRAYDATVTLSKGEGTPVTGSTMTVHARVSPAVPPLTAVTLDIVYDPTKLSVSDVSIGNLWSQTNILEKIINTPAGTLRFSIGSGFHAAPTGNNTMATVQFSTRQAGTTMITFGNDTLLVRGSRQGALNLEKKPLHVTITDAGK